MKSKTHKPASCPVCRATVIVWKRDKLPARLLRALALADHVTTSHDRRDPGPGRGSIYPYRGDS